MGIVLQILSTALFVLLIILAVAAALICCILFLPVVYRVSLTKNGEFYASGSVRWLFGAVWFSFKFRDKVFRWELRIFGYPLGKRLRGKKAKKDDEAEHYEAAKKQPTIMPGQKAGDEIRNSEKSVRSGAGAGARDKDSIRRLNEDAAFEEERKPSFGEKISFTFQGLCDKLKQAGELKALFNKVKPILAKLIKAVMPRKLSGYISFGFDDPATTGYLLQ